MTYIQGAVIPVPTANRQAYREASAGVAAIFKAFGAIRVVDIWGVDIPDGTTTDFKRAVKATGDETVVMSWITWPDKATCDAANGRMQSDARMQSLGDMPFDMRRMIFGGFEPMVDTDER